MPQENDQGFRNVTTFLPFVDADASLSLALGGMQGFWDWDLVNGTVRFSPHARRLLGCCATDPLLETIPAIRELLHEDDRPLFDAAVNQSLRGQAPNFQAETRIRHKDGHYIWIRSTGAITERDEDGQPTWMIGTSADITVAKALAEERERNIEQLRLAIDGAQIGIWYWAIPDDILECSDRCQALLGLPQCEAATIKTFFSALHPEDLERVKQLVDDAIAHRKDYAAEYRVVHCDGSIHWVSALGRVYTHPGGGVRGMGGILLDIDATKRYERELEDAQRAAEVAGQAKAEFLAHMSHEIRTPMNAVINITKLLQQEPLTPAQSELVGTIDQAGQSLLRIINDILDFSKIEAGQLQFEREPYDLGVVLTRVDLLLREAACKKGIDLTLVPPPAGLGSIIGDSLRLEQVLLNLINNAIKFTTRGKVELRVTTRQQTHDEGWLRFEVEDTGIGIAPDAIPTLFEPFVQVGSEIARHCSGTGLGLPICRRLVELMGGQIGVISRPGVGSTFWFEIPYVCDGQAVASSATPAPAGESGPALVGLRVLAADDNRINLLILEKCLQKEGAKVTLAADGQQALQILRAQPQGCDLVLMDLRMPVMDGLAATRAIRADPALARIPVIALTAGVMAEERTRALAAGVDDFLTKPLELQRMVRMLATIKSERPQTA